MRYLNAVFAGIGLLLCGCASGPKVVSPENIRQAVASTSQAPCRPEHEAQNLKSIGVIQRQKQYLVAFSENIKAVNDASTDMGDVDRIGYDAFFAPPIEVRTFTCLPSYNQYVQAWNEMVMEQRRAIPLLEAAFLRIIVGAEGRLARLIVAKKELIAAMGGTSPDDFNAARRKFDDLVSDVRRYNLHDVKTSTRSFSASDFLSRYQEASTFSGNFPAKQVVEDFSGDVKLTTGNVYANIEVRHRSFGPGFCNVDTRSSLGQTITTNAPPAIWSDWQVLSSYNASLSVDVSTTVNCDTGVQSQVRYWR